LPPGHSPAVWGQSPRPAADQFQQVVAPILAKNCLGCHNDRVRSGKLSLEALNDPAVALQHAALWEKVLAKVTAGEMPPRPRAPLSASDLAAVSDWIRSVPGVSVDAPGSAGPADPGRVTARRLNRAEYNNTVRDLLGVMIRPADEFPVDDSGYGFDNIGDVLSLSPMLMEKYMNAARVVARAAVFGESYPDKPGQLVVLTPKRCRTTCTRRNENPYSMRGTLYATYHFPVMRIRVQVALQELRGRGKPVVQAVPSPGGCRSLHLPSADVANLRSSAPGTRRQEEEPGRAGRRPTGNAGPARRSCQAFHRSSACGRREGGGQRKYGGTQLQLCPRRQHRAFG
jgi:hypothetical protein